MQPSRSRRVPPAQTQTYAAVPQSPRVQAPAHGTYVQPPRQTNGPRPPSVQNYQNQNGRAIIAQGVANGQIGSGYGPYSYQPPGDSAMYSNGRFSAASERSSVSGGQSNGPNLANTAAAPPTTTTVPNYLWDKDPDVDDALHNPDAPLAGSAWATFFSLRGWLNVGALVILLAGLMMLFVGYPILTAYSKAHLTTSGFNLGGINGTGQIPDLPGLPSLIDSDTPSSVYSRTGSDGKTYNLVFSDEFNNDGRTFYPGDDPFWEAQDLHYWPTGDVEWYDPGQITTADGKLVITMAEQENHDLDFMSGMLTSWNKLCFTTAYIEISASLPGTPNSPGFWPGLWTMGNLGRAGFGATTEGTWPYSYDACDVGTFPNQTAKDGTPAAAATGGSDGSTISFLPGQRVSACTCPGSDHPGPSTSDGRGVPEIDILEAQVDVSLAQWRGQVSQSAQVAPFNYQYQFDNTTVTISDSTLTEFNSYQGGQYQQAVSALTYLDDTDYGGGDSDFTTFAVEYFSNPSNRDQGYIQWYSQGSESWKITSATIGADTTTEISQRLISEEPMYLVFNLGMAPGFQAQDWQAMTFPNHMYIDYVRIYQREGTSEGITCDPSSRPTAQYIADHEAAYTNANWTTWAAAGYTFPRNSLYDGC